MNMNWTRLSSVKLFEHPRHSVYEDEVLLPNGNKTKYLHFGKVNDAGMVLAENEEGRFLFQKEYSYPPNEVLYQLPGGLIGSNEEPIVGAARELAEESNLSGDLELLGWFYLHNRRSNQKMFVYHATNLTRTTSQKDPEEMFEDHWLSEEEVDNLIRMNEIRNYSALAGWALFKSKK